MVSIRKAHVLCLMLGLALAGVPVFAADSDKDKVKTEVKTFERVVVRDGSEGEEPEVLFWSSDDGNGPPQRIPFAHAMLLGRGYIGVGLTDLGPDLRRHFGIDSESGVVISRVEKDSPAEKAGLQVGDVIVEVEQETVRHSGDLSRAIRGKKAGETVRIDVLRDGRLQAHDVAVGERDRKLMALDGLPMKLEGEVDVPMMRAIRMLEHPAFKDRVKAYGDRERALEERLKQLEERLIEMEKKLRENR